MAKSLLSLDGTCRGLLANRGPAAGSSLPVSYTVTEGFRSLRARPLERRAGKASERPNIFALWQDSGRGAGTSAYASVKPFEDLTGKLRRARGRQIPQARNSLNEYRRGCSVPIRGPPAALSFHIRITSGRALVSLAHERSSVLRARN